MGRTEWITCFQTILFVVFMYQMHTCALSTVDGQAFPTGFNPPTVLAASEMLCVHGVSKKHEVHKGVIVHGVWFQPSIGFSRDFWNTPSTPRCQGKSGGCPTMYRNLWGLLWQNLPACQETLHEWWPWPACIYDVHDHHNYHCGILYGGFPPQIHVKGIRVILEVPIWYSHGLRQGQSTHLSSKFVRNLSNFFVAAELPWRRLHHFACWLIITRITLHHVQASDTSFEVLTHMSSKSWSKPQSWWSKVGDTQSTGNA